MAEYENIAKGRLKLKGVSDQSLSKKKKKKKEKRKKAELMLTQDPETPEKSTESGTKPIIKRTKAEMSFENSQKKRQEERLLDKASKTHKDRIMEFNERLDNLTEHFDIPKVSWTK